MSLTSKLANALELFYSYDHKDERLRKRLETHLSNLQRRGLITGWHDRNISAGTAWASEIDKHLNTAHIILLLISPDFIASEYCYSVEMMRAMERHKAGEARIIPVILRPTDWEGTPFKQLQALPTNAKPLTRWQDIDEALLDVANGIRKVVEELSTNLFPTHPSFVCNIPYRRNPSFTGRENLLKHLHETLTTTKATALTQPQAITGLGGIGKTQTAVEYAYRYCDEYRFVLWVSAATRDTLISDFVTLADLLHLPEKEEQNQNIVVAAIKRWLESHKAWLFILDNADDLVMTYDFLPTGNNGHILLTTRAQAAGTLAQMIEVEKMGKDEGTLLLLRRAKMLAPEAPLDQTTKTARAEAEAIVVEVDGLPLALDQAGAYIEETGCDLSEYLKLYQIRRKELLGRPGQLPPGHPETVSTTWSLSFQKIEQANRAAAELIRLCAFLAPDAIPEEIIRDGASDLGTVLRPVAADPFKLNAAIEVLRQYSLLRRDRETKMLSIHRLVQAVLIDRMTPKKQRQWVERAVRAVNRAFPGNVDEVATWPQCQRCLPQAQACAVLIAQYSITVPEAAHLLNRAGYYLHFHARYEEAEPLYQRALAIREQVLGSEHPDTATTLHHLAWLYRDRDQYEEAELLYQRALAIREQVLGSEHPFTASTLNHLATLYQNQGQYGRAEPLYQRALAIKEKKLGRKDPSTANTLHNLAKLYQNQGKYEQAELLYQRALAIREQMQGSKHPYAAGTLHQLATLYEAQGKYEQAEPLYQRALAIYEQQLGPQHPDTVATLNNLAGLYKMQGKYEQAEPLYRRTLTIREQRLGAEHPQTRVVRGNYASLLRTLGRDEEAIVLETNW